VEGERKRWVNNVCKSEDGLSSQLNAKYTAAVTEKHMCEPGCASGVKARPPSYISAKKSLTSLCINLHLNKTVHILLVS